VDVALRFLIIDIKLKLILQLHAATFFPREKARVTYWVGVSMGRRTNFEYYGEEKKTPVGIRTAITRPSTL
jgi:hypothetical protein